MPVSDWNITNVTVVGNTTTVDATNPITGATVELEVTYDPLQPQYEASLSFSHPLTPSQVSDLNAILISKVRNHKTTLGLAPPPLLAFPASVNVTVSRVTLNAATKISNANAAIAIGQSILSTLDMNTTGGSVQVLAGGNACPFFIIERGGTGEPFSSVDSASIHRHPVTGNLEASFSGHSGPGTIVADSITLAGARIPGSADVLCSVPLNFTNGTLAVPVDLANANMLLLIGTAIRDSYNDGVGAVMAVAAAGKYLCLRNLLIEIGAGAICIACVMITAGGTAATAGAAAPGLVAAVVGCLGWTCLEYIDLILTHLGLA